MRSLLLSGMLLVASVPAVAASPPPPGVQRAFEQGNRRYAEGDYATALENYEKALTSGWTSGALHYNVAGAHHRLGHTGEAVRHYEKARRLLPPGSPRLQHNLDVVRSRIDAPPPPPRSFFAAARERLTGLMPPVGYLAAGLLVFVLALAWWVRARSDAGERFRPGAPATGLLAAGVLVAAVGLALSAAPGEGQAVALRGPLTLRDAPAATADSTAALPEGVVLRLTDRRDGWTRVRSSRGDEGWARAETLGEI